MPPKKKKREENKRVNLWTPPGQFSHPYFAAPDTGRQLSDGKYKTDFLTSKPVFKEKGKILEEAVREVGKDYFGSDFSLKNTDYRHPFKDTDKDDKIANEAMKGCILIRAKSGGGLKADKPARQPTLIGPRKGSDGKFPLLSKDEVAAIKGGDWGTLNILVYAYDAVGDGLPGVTFLLNGVQFWKKGESFGQGNTSMMETAEEFADETDEPGNDEVGTDEVDEDDGDDSIV